VGVPLATTLANTVAADFECAVVRATLTTRVARGTPTPPALRGALVVIRASGMTSHFSGFGGDSGLALPMIHRGDSDVTRGDSSANLAVIPA